MRSKHLPKTAHLDQFPETYLEVDCSWTSLIRRSWFVAMYIWFVCTTMRSSEQPLKLQKFAGYPDHTQRIHWSIYWPWIHEWWILCRMLAIWRRSSQTSGNFSCRKRTLRFLRLKQNTLVWLLQSRKLFVFRRLQLNLAHLCNWYIVHRKTRNHGWEPFIFQSRTRYGEREAFCLNKGHQFETVPAMFWYHFSLFFKLKKDNLHH